MTKINCNHAKTQSIPFTDNYYLHYGNSEPAKKVQVCDQCFVKFCNELLDNEVDLPNKLNQKWNTIIDSWKMRDLTY